MDAITMQSTNLLINQLKEDYPSFHFQATTEFLWSADRQTIHIDPTVDNCNEFILHELSHALLNHEGYRRDIDLIKLERDAWEYAKTHLSATYNQSIDEEMIQDNLDTYREWLHARSKCPDCEATGLQTKAQNYLCLFCNNSWRVNEARLCALRRYTLATK